MVLIHSSEYLTPLPFDYSGRGATASPYEKNICTKIIITLNLKSYKKEYWCYIVFM